MTRTQIQLTAKQLQALRQVSAATGRSIADLIRQGVELYLSVQMGSSHEERRERAIGVAGKFSSGSKDVSVDHDRYLAEAFQK